MTDVPPAGPPPKGGFPVYMAVFFTVAFLVGFGLFKGFGLLLSPEDAPPLLVSVTRSTGDAIGFGVLFLIGVVAVHMVFKISAYKSELLLLQLLPAIWMLLCFDGFKNLEPKENHNSGAFLLLGGAWLFNRKDLKDALLAGRVRTWCMAALFCAVGFLSGMLLIIWLGFSWAGLPIFILTLIVVASVKPDPVLKKKPDPAASAPRRKSKWPAVIALVLVVVPSLLYFVISDSVASQSLRAFLGSTNAQFQMGWRYRVGDGVGQDYSTAAVYFEKAAASGSARAQYDLGLLHYYGLGVPEATGDALTRWLDRAAKQDYAPAVTMLGLIARRDEHNPAKAMELWRRAAYLNDPFGEYLLGTAYLDLASVATEGERDLTLALYWLEKARRSSVNPVGNLLPQVWSTVPEESLERVTAVVFQNLQKGTEP